MATATRNPTSDVSFTGTWNGSVGTRWQAVDDYPDTANPVADSITHGTTTAGEGLFGFSAFSIPAGSTAISVQVQFTCFKNGSQASAINGRIRCNDATGRDSADGTTNPGNGNAAISTVSKNYANNPKTGAAWTVNDVNGVGTNGLTAFGVVSSDANPSITLSSIRLQVTYTPPVPNQGSGTVGATGTVAGAGKAVKAGGGTVSAVAGVSGAGKAVRSGSGAAAATATVSGAGKAFRYGAGSVSASGTVVGVGFKPAVPVKEGAGTVAATGSIVGVGESPAIAVPSGFGSIAATGTIVGIGKAVRSGSASVSAAGSIAGAGQEPTLPVRQGAGSVGAAAVVVGVGWRLSGGSGPIDATATLVGNGYKPGGNPGQGRGKRGAFRSGTVTGGFNGGISGGIG